MKSTRKPKIKIINDIQAQTKQLNDGTQITTYNNGRKEIIYKNGTRELREGNGDSMIYYKNGDTRQVNSRYNT